tara:strand:- start:16518 stop:17213 length:696 start_codon:yes stop_codon:yes gene_type:complete
MISFDKAISNKEVNRLKNFFLTIFNVYNYNKEYMPVSGSLVNRLHGYKTIQKNKGNDAYSILTCHNPIQDVLKKIHNKVNETYPSAQGTNIFLKFFGLEDEILAVGNADNFNMHSRISKNYNFDDIYIIAPLLPFYIKVKSKNNNTITNFTLKKENLYLFKDEIFHNINSLSIGLIITYTEKENIPVFKRQAKINTENNSNQFSTYNHTNKLNVGIDEVDVKSIFLDLENI